MDCIVCGDAAGFHRAVLSEFRERRLGGLCRECERVEFGRSLERGFFRETDGCMLCARDGHVALPVGEAVARRDENGEVESEVTFEVTDATLRLCDEHLDMLAAGDAQESGVGIPREFW